MGVPGPGSVWAVEDLYCRDSLGDCGTAHHGIQTHNCLVHEANLIKQGEGEGRLLSWEGGLCYQCRRGGEGVKWSTAVLGAGGGGECCKTAAR
jgi:hypothetical protein